MVHPQTHHYKVDKSKTPLPPIARPLQILVVHHVLMLIVIIMAPKSDPLVSLAQTNFRQDIILL